MLAAEVLRIEAGLVCGLEALTGDERHCFSSAAGAGHVICHGERSSLVVLWKHNTHGLYVLCLADDFEMHI